MKRLLLWCGGVLAAGVLLAVPYAAALDVPPAPPLNRPIVDQTGTLSGADIDKLSAEIAALRQQKDFQLGVLMVATLGADSLEDYSLQVARQWGVGEKPKNSGVLLLIVKDDRKLRIEVGSGQEGDLTDARAARIIRNTMTPKLRENDFVGAISAGASEISAAIQSQPEQEATPEASGWDIAVVIGGVLMMGLSAISWLASIWARSKSWWAGGIVGGLAGGVLAFAAGAVLWSLVAWAVLIVGGLLLDFFVSRNYKSHASSGSSPSWWAGGDWFGGSGGSSSGGSFGGGGFSGGGASGSW